MSGALARTGAALPGAGGSRARGGPGRRMALLRALVVRDVKGLYRRSVLGPAWALLQPLIYMLVFVFLRRVLDLSGEGAPYAIFTFSALVPWTFFSNAVVRSAPSIVANAGIIKKIAVTREIFPAAAVATSLLDLVLASGVLLGMMAWFDLPLRTSALWLPPLVALAAALALGVGLAAAALGTYRRDVVFALPFAMQFWLLATPVMYPLERVPEAWRLAYALNPMVGIIEGFRAALIHGAAPDPALLAGAAAGTALVWALAWPLFRYASRYFADVL